jgi:glycosyltransferase involved in cell wall biosynthesis
MNGTDRKKKVLIVTPCILPVPSVRGGAVEKLITDIIDENERREALEITLITIDDESIREIKYRHTRIILVKQGAVNKLIERVTDKLQRMMHVRSAVRLFDRNIIKTLKSQIPDLSVFDVIVAENMAGLAEKLVCEAGKIGSRARICFHVHNNIDMYRSPAAIRKLADKGVTFITVSEYLKNEILATAPKAHISVLLNGLDASLMDINLRENRKRLRDKYGIPQEATVVLYLGRIIAEKGVYEAVHAFAGHKRRNKGSKLFLVLAGDSTGAGGSITAYGERVLRELRTVSDSSINPGKIPYEQIAEAYALADVLAVPTLDNEPFGMVVLEGMAMGMPVITTASGGIAEVLEDGEGSIKVSRESVVQDMEKAFDRISDAGYQTRLEEMGAHNRKLFLNKQDVRKEDYYSRFLDALGIEAQAAQMGRKEHI